MRYQLEKPRLDPSHSKVRGYGGKNQILNMLLATMKYEKMRAPGTRSLFYRVLELTRREAGDSTIRSHPTNLPAAGERCLLPESELYASINFGRQSRDNRSGHAR